MLVPIQVHATTQCVKHLQNPLPGLSFLTNDLLLETIKDTKSQIHSYDKKLPIVIEAVYNTLLTNIPNIWNSLPKTVTGSTSFSTLPKR